MVADTRPHTYAHSRQHNRVHMHKDVIQDVRAPLGTKTNHTLSSEAYARSAFHVRISKLGWTWHGSNTCSANRAAHAHTHAQEM